MSRLKMNREALGLRETVLEEHPSTLASMNNLALVLGNSRQVRAGGRDASRSRQAV
jgi:hypothetical protein